ncbi:DNA-binding transcriptional regulator YbjK [Mumia flava]|uniref:DNA-binding transcriptional regulator YbjK n=1 Tax=Mumia flava TaxID=1348852 RepID=A0A2M9AQ72_9ACTN|nr:TetR family transcriptional regulator [Mumia flava]PJJ47851.1 DNA-binding transcriptional regulator YbjK [Mumia flava]
MNADRQTAILEAARQQFARHGYAGSTIRSIAAEADVDPALVMHYFRTKDALFAATLDQASALIDGVAAALEGPRDGLAERLARAYLGAWEAPQTSLTLLSVARSALSSPVAAQIVRQMLEGRLLARQTTVRPERLNLVGAQLFGIATARYVLRTEPLASMTLDEVVVTIAPALHALLVD